MGRLLLGLLLILALTACGGGSGKKSDTAQGNDVAGQNDVTDDVADELDVAVEPDVAKGPDLAVAPLECSTACGGTVCGEGTCYTCDPDGKCADLSSSLWDQGFFGTALWAP